MNGMLISLEGIDGCGKSTQASLLLNCFLSSGRSSLKLREPGGTVIGETIRSLLLNPSLSNMSHRTELFLYLASRSQLTSSVIIPALSRGTDVIMDRFIDSTVAYQGYARGFGAEMTIELNRIATAGLVPDVTFFIDCEPETTLLRLSGSFDRVESEGLHFMERVRDGFLALQNRFPERIIICNGNSSVNDVHDEIVHYIQKKFGISLLKTE